MSFPAMSWAVRQKLPCTQKIVLLMLAERHNKDTGQCNPSHDRLADDCGLTRRSVVDQIAKLEAAGYLSVLHRAKGNAKLPNQYVLNLHFGVPEKVKTTTDDPYLVVNDVHKGGESDSQGVVNDVHNLVNDVHKGGAPVAHKPVIEPVKNQESEPVVGADAPKKAKPAARATVLPDDFQPDDTALQIAKDFGLDAFAEQTAFSDFHAAKGSTFKDWQAAFRTWLRNANKFGQRAAAMTPNRKSGPVRENFDGRDYGNGVEVL